MTLPTFEREKRARRREKIKRERKIKLVAAYLRDLKLKTGCSLCGYSKSARALQFHHLDPKQKLKCVGFIRTSWTKLHSEIAKCVLLCANCHMELEEKLEQDTVGVNHSAPTNNLNQAPLPGFP